MRILRGLLGTLLWILAGVLGLVALLLCVTIILLPLGIPLLRVAKTLFGKAGRLMMPRSVAHPVEETKRKGRKLKPDKPDLAGDAAAIKKKAKNKTREMTGRRRKLFA